MKKLMLTSALAGLLVSGNAIAQTTISGELRLNLKATEAKVATGTTTSSKRGFGNEQQINFATKGKLNVGGLDYAAGFSIENDGNQASTLFNENTYMDITNASSGTTLSIGLDHIQRSDSDRSAAVLVGFTPNELSTDGHSLSRFRQNLGPAVSQGMGIAILQTVPNIGTLSYNYVPTTANQIPGTAVGSTTGSRNSENLSEQDQESGYEYGFTGGLGVKGLNTYYFKSAAKKEVGATTKAEAKSWGANYNFGQFTVGYAKTEEVNGVAGNDVEVGMIRLIGAF